VISTGDAGSKKLTVQILLDCGCATNVISLESAREAGVEIKEANNVSLVDAAGQSMKIAGQCVDKMDIPTLAKSAFLCFIVTPDLPH
jgi:hypothetical protein